MQLKEEEIIETPSSETEMSVAVEMAKLAQSSPAMENNTSNNTSSSAYYSEAEMAVRSLNESNNSYNYGDNR